MQVNVTTPHGAVDPIFRMKSAVRAQRRLVRLTPT
jgi:hypothetical protein